MTFSIDTKFNINTECSFDFNRVNSFEYNFDTEYSFDIICNTGSLFTTDTAQQTFSLVPYYGGKHVLAKHIIPYIYDVAEANSATTYLELCGGGARCLLNLDQKAYRFEHKYYNEFDETMCCLFNVARDKDKIHELLKYLRSIDYPLLETDVNSEACQEHYNNIFRSGKLKLDKSTGLVIDNSYTEIEKAAAAFITCRLSRIANRRDFNFKNLNSYFSSYDRILKAPEHLENTTVLQGDYVKYLLEFGQRRDVVIFIDPPYHPQSRSRDALNIYPKEMPTNEQQKMVELLCKTKCSVVMSGYDPTDYSCDDYKILEKYGYEKMKIAKVHISSSNINGSLKGRKPLCKTECLWVKRASI